MLSRPRFDAPAHGVMPFPTRVDAAFALDARELHVERVQQRDGRRVGRLKLRRRIEEADDVEIGAAILERPGTIDEPL